MHIVAGREASHEFEEGLFAQAVGNFSSSIALTAEGLFEEGLFAQAVGNAQAHDVQPDQGFEFEEGLFAQAVGNEQPARKPRGCPSGPVGRGVIRASGLKLAVSVGVGDGSVVPFEEGLFAQAVGNQRGRQPSQAHPNAFEEGLFAQAVGNPSHCL